MRPYVFALVATSLLFSAASSFAAPPVKMLNGMAQAVNAHPVRVLGLGGSAEGTSVRVNTLGKFMELQTANGLVRVPLNGKVMLQNGETGPLVPVSPGDLNNVSALKIGKWKIKIKLGKGGITITISRRF